MAEIPITDSGGLGCCGLLNHKWWGEVFLKHRPLEIEEETEVLPQFYGCVFSLSWGFVLYLCMYYVYEHE